MKTLNINLYAALNILILVLGVALLPFNEFKYLSIILVLFALNFFYFYRVVHLVTNNKMDQKGFLPAFFYKMIFLCIAIGVAVLSKEDILLKVAVLYIFQLIILLISIKSSLQKN